MSRKPEKELSRYEGETQFLNRLCGGMFALLLIGTGYNAWFQSAIVGPAQQGTLESGKSGYRTGNRVSSAHSFLLEHCDSRLVQVEQSDASEPNRYRVDRGHIPGVSQHSNPKQPFCSGEPVPHTSSPVCREIVDPERLLLIEKTTPKYLPGAHFKKEISTLLWYTHRQAN